MKKWASQLGFAVKLIYLQGHASKHIICCPVMIVLHEMLLIWYLAEAAASSTLDVTNEGNISSIIKPTRCTNFTNLFWHETLHVSDSSFVYRQDFIHCTPSNGLCHTGLWTAFEQDQDVSSWSCSKAAYKPVWRVPVPSVQWMNSWWWTEELSKTCRVSCQNKFVKLVDLVGLL